MPKKKPQWADGSNPDRIVGWREWIALTDLGSPIIKAKIDTGARSSALHAFDIETFTRKGVDLVRFAIHPRQKSAAGEVVVEAELLEYRLVRSSDGRQTRRPVIVTHLLLQEKAWPIELTLASRDAMGFRMLIGRQALRGRVLVDPEASYLSGSRKDLQKQIKRKTS